MNNLLTTPKTPLASDYDKCASVTRAQYSWAGVNAGVHTLDITISSF